MGLTVAWELSKNSELSVLLIVARPPLTSSLG